MSASLPAFWDAFIWSIFEGSIDISLGAFDIPQSCVFAFVTAFLSFISVNKDGLNVAVGDQIVRECMFLTNLYTFDVISIKKLVL